jgi:hypothetical protein
MNGPLTGGPAKYAGLLPSGLPAAYYADGAAAGASVPDLVITTAGVWTVPTFNYADTGLLSLYLDGTKVASIDLAANFGEDNRGGEQVISEYNNQGDGSALTEGQADFDGGRLKLLWVRKKDFKKWQIGSAQITISQALPEGVHTLKVVHELPVVQETATYQLRFDTDTTVPDVDIPTLAEKSAIGKYLSGVKLYTVGDSFDAGIACSNVYKNSYHPSQVAGAALPGATTVYINPASVPAAGDALAKSLVLLLTQVDVWAENAVLTATARDVYGHSVSKTSPAAGIMVHTYGVKGTPVEEFFTDEAYRLPRSFDFESKPGVLTGHWPSAAVLNNGDAQCYASQAGPALVYPSKNFSAGCLPANVVDYSGFTGSQTYCRAFRAAAGQSSVCLTLYGLAGGIAQLGSGDINIEIKLPGLAGWGDAANPYSAAGDKSQDGWGMLSGSISYTGGNAALLATFGGLSTVDSAGLVYVRITMLNKNRRIDRIKTNW